MCQQKLQDFLVVGFFLGDIHRMGPPFDSVDPLVNIQKAIENGDL